LGAVNRGLGSGLRTFLAAVILALASPAASALSPEQQDAVARVETYLNHITTMKARFAQLTSNGGFAEGDLYVQRPGRLRFEYDPPHTVLLVADGVTLLFYDKELKQATYIPLWETPLWFLIRERVDLSDKVEILDVTQNAATLTVKVRQTDDDGDGGELSLVFSDQPLTLRKWEVTDAQGIVTQVALLNPEFGLELERKYFRHDDLDLPGPRGATPER
jgi:outer membrane lipoprotein-sorting protein